MSFEQLQQALRGLQGVNREEKRLERSIELYDAKENVINNNILLISRLNNELTDEYSLVHQENDLTTSDGLLAAHESIESIVRDKTDRLNQEYTTMRGMPRGDYEAAIRGFKNQSIKLKEGMTNIATVKIQNSRNKMTNDIVANTNKGIYTLMNANQNLPPEEIVAALDIGLNSLSTSYDELSRDIVVGFTSTGEPIISRPTPIPQSHRDLAKFNIISTTISEYFKKGDLVGAEAILKRYTNPANKIIIEGSLDRPDSPKHGMPFISIINDMFTNQVNNYGKLLDEHANRSNSRLLEIERILERNPEDPDALSEKGEIENEIISSYEKLRKIISEGGLTYSLETIDRADRGWVKHIININNSRGGPHLSGSQGSFANHVERARQTANTPGGVHESLILSDALRMWLVKQVPNSVPASPELVSYLRNVDIPMNQRVNLLKEMNRRKNMFKKQKRNPDPDNDEFYGILDYKKHFGIKNDEN
ncbi:MAG TPA: hypothetical protein EYO59_00005, partial [Chromatiaceae bacterium]|nr:hypothetical protein [Chromatiaceae bacterium]